MAKNSFPTIRKVLAKYDREALLSLIGDLYAINKQNRDFLETRFIPNSSDLDRYKQLIGEALFPKFSD